MIWEDVDYKYEQAHSYGESIQRKMQNKCQVLLGDVDSSYVSDAKGTRGE